MIVMLLVLAVGMGANLNPVLAQDEAPTEAPPTQETIQPTEELPTLVPTEEQTIEVPLFQVDTATPEPGFSRPIVVVTSYSGGSKKISAGKTFKVTINMKNTGGAPASNILVSFNSGDFIARGSGGVKSVADLDAGGTVAISQSLTAAESVEGKKVAYITASISYTNAAGEAFSGDATLAFNVVSGVASSGGGGYYASPTPTSNKRPQLIISAYESDVNPLQPGTTFALNLDIKNVGMADAKNVTMVMGGGSASNPGGEGGTPVPGGVAGSSGEFTNFAPIGASNIQPIGNVPVEITQKAIQKLIVNVTTNPGTYPVKFSFLYSDDKGKQYQDDQVITLLVYRLPLVEVNFYRTVDPQMVGQPGTLPIQVVNLSRSTTILGNMRITSNAGEMTNNVMLIGNLDPGGYFPLDVNFIPTYPGPAEILVTIQYTDDFNQPRQEEFKLSVDVADAPVIDTPVDAGPIMPVQETFGQKILRIIKGLFGLDSSRTNPETVPLTSEGIDGGGKPLGGGGGGGGGGEVIPVPAKP